MSIKNSWLKRGLRVLTSHGPGVLDFGILRGSSRVVNLDKSFAGASVYYPSRKEEVVVESDFTLLKIMRSGVLGDNALMSNAQNYPSWKECVEALEGPSSPNETLIALNFQKKELLSNFPLVPKNTLLIRTCFNMFDNREWEVYVTPEEGKRAWESISGKLDGTGGPVTLWTLIDVEASRILARAILSTHKVILKETWW